MYKFIGKPNQMYEIDGITMNANCPASEKTGEGPGSCGGSKEDEPGKSSHPLKSTDTKQKEDYYKAGSIDKIPKLSRSDLEDMPDNELDSHIKEHAATIEKVKNSWGSLLKRGKTDEIVKSLQINQRELSDEKERRSYNKSSDNGEQYLKSISGTKEQPKSEKKSRGFKAFGGGKTI
jgi:hypothetical protein